MTESTKKEAHLRKLSLLAVRWVARLLAVTGLALAAAAALALPAAQALPDSPFMEGDPQYPFAPKFAVTASTYQAGAHPDLRIDIRKLRNHCADPHAPGHDPSAEVWTAGCPAAYIEQNLKRIAVSLPAGLAGDPNAAPFCETGRRVGVGSGFGTTEVQWTCTNPTATPVGSLLWVAAMCNNNQAGEKKGSCWTPSDTLAPDGNLYRGTAAIEHVPVYLERPGPGEQGHLVAFIIGTDAEHGLPGSRRVDIAITVRPGDLALDSVSDSIPDVLMLCRRDAAGHEQCPRGDLDQNQPAQSSDVILTLNGATGAERGHPLLTNPTFCDPQQVQGEFQGYRYNGMSEVVEGPDEGLIPYPYGPGYLAPEGTGAGKTASATASYQASGCDAVPYGPKLDLRLKDAGPDEAPAIDATVSQEPGEATTGKAWTTFPSEFKINPKNTAKHCSAEDLRAKTCPPESRIGTMSAVSPLLPIGEELKGGIYLAGLTGDSVKLEGQLTGFIDLTIKARGGLDDANQIVFLFEDLPAAPVSQFDLHFAGGEKAAIRTPKSCGPQVIRQVFESHSGKRTEQEVPVDIEGCGEPALDAELTPRRAGRLANLELSLRGNGHRLRGARFALARDLAWGYKGAGKRGASSSAGSFTYTTSQGELRSQLKAAKAKRRTIRFLPRDTKALAGARSALATFQAGLSRGAKKKTALKLSGLPSDGVSNLELSLHGKRSGLSIRTRKGCANPLNFVALVTTTEGRRFAVSDELRLSGRGCGGGLYRSTSSRRAAGR